MLPARALLPPRALLRVAGVDCTHVGGMAGAALASSGIGSADQAGLTGATLAHCGLKSVGTGGYSSVWTGCGAVGVGIEPSGGGYDWPVRRWQ